MIFFASMLWKFSFKYMYLPKKVEGPLWSWSYGSWIYNYLCNQCLSPLTLCVRIAQARCTHTTLGTDHLTWRRGLWFFVSFRIIFLDNTRIRIFIFLSRKARIFFPKFNIRLYDKNSESDFFFPSPKSEYFFQQHWESEYFFR